MNRVSLYNASCNIPCLVCTNDFHMNFLHMSHDGINCFDKVI